MAIQPDSNTPTSANMAFDLQEDYPVIAFNSKDNPTTPFYIWSAGDQLRFGSSAGQQSGAAFHVSHGSKSPVTFNSPIVSTTTDFSAFQGNITGDGMGRVSDISTNPGDGTRHSTAELDEDPNATVSSGTMYYTDTRVHDAISVNNDTGSDTALTKNLGEVTLTHYTTTSRTGSDNFGSFTTIGKDGQVIQDISYTDEGHVSRVFVADLDDRYHPVGGRSTDDMVVNNLTINGTTTTVNQQEVNIGDTIITLAADRDSSHTPTNWTGITVERGADVDVHFHYDEDANKFRLYRGSDGPTSVTKTTETLIANIEGQVSDVSNHDTNDIAEGSNNLYFTDSRSRGSISVADNGGHGGLSYNNSTGVLTFTGPSASDVRGDLNVVNTSDGYGRLAYDNSNGQFTYTRVTDANIRGAVSAIGNISFDSTTGVFSYTERELGDGLSLSTTDTTRTMSVKPGTGVTVTANGGNIGQSVDTTSEVTFSKVFATEFNTASDMTLKQNITNISDSLDRVKQLQGVSFNWKHDPSSKKYGMIAQQVKQVIPDAVNVCDDTHAIDYGAVIAHLIEAVKTLSDKMDSLDS